MRTMGQGGFGKAANQEGERIINIAIIVKTVKNGLAGLQLYSRHTNDLSINLSINVYVESPIPRTTMRISSVSNTNSWILTTGDRSKHCTLLCENPCPSDSTAWPLLSNPSHETVKSSPVADSLLVLRSVQYQKVVKQPHHHNVRRRQRRQRQR